MKKGYTKPTLKQLSEEEVAASHNVFRD